MNTRTSKSLLNLPEHPWHDINTQAFGALDGSGKVVIDGQGVNFIQRIDRGNRGGLTVLKTSKKSFNLNTFSNSACMLMYDESSNRFLVLHEQKAVAALLAGAGYTSPGFDENGIIQTFPAGYQSKDDKNIVDTFRREGSKETRINKGAFKAIYDLGHLLVAPNNAEKVDFLGLVVMDKPDSIQDEAETTIKGREWVSPSELFSRLLARNFVHAPVRDAMNSALQHLLLKSKQKLGDRTMADVYEDTALYDSMIADGMANLMRETLTVQHSVGKNGNDKNEDAVFENEHFKAVIDGATDKTGYKVTYQGHEMTGGRMMALVIQNAMKNMAADSTMREAVEYLTLQTSQALKEAGWPEDKPNPEASVTIYSAKWNEVWRVGDGHVRVGDTLHRGGKAIDVATGTIRKQVLETKTFMDEINEALGIAVPVGDIGRAAIQPILDQQWKLANNAYSRYGYPVINGKTVPMNLLEAPLKVKEGDYVVLASDGFDDPQVTLEETLARQAEINEADPMRIGLVKGIGPSTKGMVDGKPHDDASYLGFAVPRKKARFKTPDVLYHNRAAAVTSLNQPVAVTPTAIMKAVNDVLQKPVAQDFPAAMGPNGFVSQIMRALESRA